MTEPPVSSSICLDCGLCCNGTLHARVTCSAEDSEAVTAAGLSLERTEEGWTFSQPCPRLENHSCQVYEIRPPICRSYRCALLERTESGAMSAAEARARIREVKGLVAAVAAVAPGATRSALRREAWEKLKQEHASAAPADAPRLAMALLNVATLDQMLDRWFRRKG